MFTPQKSIKTKICKTIKVFVVILLDIQDIRGKRNDLRKSIRHRESPFILCSTAIAPQGQHPRPARTQVAQCVVTPDRECNVNVAVCTEPSNVLNYITLLSKYAHVCGFSHK